MVRQLLGITFCGMELLIRSLTSTSGQITAIKAETCMNDDVPSFHVDVTTNPCLEFIAGCSPLGYKHTVSIDYLWPSLFGGTGSDSWLFCLWQKKRNHTHSTISTFIAVFDEGSSKKIRATSISNRKCDCSAGSLFYIACQQLLWPLSWHTVMKSSFGNSFEDFTPVDEILRMQRIFLTREHHGNTPSIDCQGGMPY